MSNYPIWWDTTITVYNKFEDPQTRVVRWFRTVLTDCFWKYAGNKINIGQTVLETNNTICRIPKNEKFLERYLWEQQTNDAMENYFTLSPQDIIIKGEISDEINEYQSGSRSTDLIAKYKRLQGCIEIQEVALNVGPGRNNEHYYVSGI